MANSRYDVIVVGAGHAGCEAGLASARMGCHTAVITLNLERVAHMPCNCSIGGPAKGHLVREIDALGGQMGIAIDLNLTHIRFVGTGKGPAIQTLRAHAEFRLALRHDNADQRLTPIGRQVGLVDDIRWARFTAKRKAIEKGTRRWGNGAVGEGLGVDAEANGARWTGEEGACSERWVSGSDIVCAHASCWRNAQTPWRRIWFHTGEETLLAVGGVPMYHPKRGFTLSRLAYAALGAHLVGG